MEIVKRTKYNRIKFFTQTIYYNAKTVFAEKSFPKQSLNSVFLLNLSATPVLVTPSNVISLAPLLKLFSQRMSIWKN
jgi:hypothetical protein